MSHPEHLDVQSAHHQPSQPSQPINRKPEMYGIPTPGEWFVIHCLPLKERYAAMALQEQRGVSVYLPEVVRYFRGQVQYAPLFPRYLFALIDLQLTPPSQINATPGVVRLVTFDYQPQPIPAAVVYALYERVEQYNSQGGLPEQTLQPGDTVEITSGPLGGLEAVFVGPITPSKRVRVLLEFMGHLNEVEMDREVLMLVSSAPTLKRPRRTRGQRRRVRSNV